MDNALVFLHFALFVALYLLVQEVLQLLEEVRTALLDLPQEPVPVFLGADQCAEFLHLLMVAVDNDDIYIVLVEFVDSPDAGGEYGRVHLRACAIHKHTLHRRRLYLRGTLEDPRGDLLGSLHLLAEGN